MIFVLENEVQYYHFYLKIILNFFLILSSETAGELTRTSVCVFGHDPVKYRLLIHQHLEPLK